MTKEMIISLLLALLVVGLFMYANYDYRQKLKQAEKDGKKIKRVSRFLPPVIEE